MTGAMDAMLFWSEWGEPTWLEHTSFSLAALLVLANLLIGLREWLRRAALIAEKRNGSARFTAVVMIVMAGWRVLFAVALVYGSLLWLRLPNSGYFDALQFRRLWLFIVVVMLGKSIFDLWAGGRIHRIHDREYEGTAH